MYQKRRVWMTNILYATASLMCSQIAAASGRAALDKDVNAPTLNLNTTVLHRSGDWIEVSWKNVQSPSIYEAVALVVPAGADYRQTPPSKHRWASESPTHLKDGAGSLRFRMLNHQADMQFILVTNLTDWAGMFDVLAESPILSPSNPNEPLQGHLARTPDPSEMLVQWTTRDRGSPSVRWGTMSGQLSFTSSAATDTYTRQDMCGGVANSTGFINPGLFHTAKMSGLAPDTQYFYAYGSPDFGYSEEQTFTTAPEAGADSTVKLLAIADLGYCEEDGSMTTPGNYRNPVAVQPIGTTAEVITEVQNAVHMGWVDYCAALYTARRMQDDISGRTLIIHNGDVSYAEGSVYGWNVFMDMMAPLVQRAPYMLIPGNHERDWPGTGTRFDFPPAHDSGGECGVAYDKRFPMPLQGPDKEWYSFDHGPIHFLQFSSEHDFAPGSEQFAWILKDLNSVNRSVTPWLIAGFHRPFYTDSIYGNADAGDVGFTDAIRDALERLFFQFQVDATWFGHVHSYSRTCPVFQRNCMGYAEDGSALAPVHMLIGHAGAPYSWAISPETPPYYESVAIKHGYLRVEANRTALHMEAVDSLHGEVIDSVTLRKPPGWRPDQARQLSIIALFHSNYTPTWLELSGINGPAEDLILRPAEALLFSDPDLLEKLRNATLVKDPDAYDTIEALNEIFEPINAIFEERLADFEQTSEAAKFFYHNYFSQLFALYKTHADGMIKAQSMLKSPVKEPFNT